MDCEKCGKPMVLTNEKSRYDVFRCTDIDCTGMKVVLRHRERVPDDTIREPR